MSKAYIVCRDVRKRFGEHEVLKGVSTEFQTGQVTVIIGASGSGKSTLLRAINRLEPHDSGSITIDGVEVSDDQRTLQKQRSEVGMVPVKKETTALWAGYGLAFAVVAALAAVSLGARWP